MHANHARNSQNRFACGALYVALSLFALATLGGCRPSRDVARVEAGKPPAQQVVRAPERTGSAAASLHPLAFRIAADDQERTVISYMAAARRNAIPCAFLISQEGRIAWIGHPAGLEAPLAELVHTGRVSESLQEEARPQATLHVGDTAPPLHIDEWIRGKPVRQLESGQVYVLEFWATWCGPCVESLPHLSELQQQYADRVTIIAISKESRQTLAQFVGQLR